MTCFSYSAIPLFLFRVLPFLFHSPQPIIRSHIPYFRFYMRSNNMTWVAVAIDLDQSWFIVRNLRVAWRAAAILDQSWFVIQVWLKTPTSVYMWSSKPWRDSPSRYQTIVVKYRFKGCVTRRCDTGPELIHSPSTIPQLQFTCEVVSHDVTRRHGTRPS